MAVYQVVEIGDPILKEIAKPIKNINERVHLLLDNLRDTMREMNGCGLAAPQIGIPKRAIVVEVEETLYEFLNPEIAEGQGEVSDIEACLSIPGKRGLVKRMDKIVIKGQNRDGVDVSIEAEGFLARAFQHEIDHLDGILYVDRAEWVESAREADEEIDYQE
ncbi:MAG: peptide deformylase [Acidobacteriota bacterium]